MSSLVLRQERSPGPTCKPHDGSTIPPIACRGGCVRRRACAPAATAVVGAGSVHRSGRPGHACRGGHGQIRWTTLGKVSGGDFSPLWASISRCRSFNRCIPLMCAPRSNRRNLPPSPKTQVIEATATVKYAVRPNEAGRIYRTIAGNDPGDLQSSNQGPKHHSAVIAESPEEPRFLPVRARHHCHRMERDISALVERTVAEAEELKEIRGLDLTGEI